MENNLKKVFNIPAVYDIIKEGMNDTYFHYPSLKYLAEFIPEDVSKMFVSEEFIEDFIQDLGDYTLMHDCDRINDTEYEFHISEVCNKYLIPIV